MNIEKPKIRRLCKETPSARDFNYFKATFPEIEFKNLDDMKLIRDSEFWQVVGICNRAGDTKMFETLLSTQTV